MTFDELSAYLHQFRRDELPRSNLVPGAEIEPPVHPVFDGSVVVVKCARGRETPPHLQPYYEAVYTLEGCVTCLVDDERIDVPAGSMLLLAANVRHQLCPCGLDDIAVSIYVDENVMNPHVYQTIRQLPSVGDIFHPSLLCRHLLIGFGVGSQADLYGRMMLCRCFEPGVHSDLSTQLLLQLFLTEADAVLNRVVERPAEGIESEIARIARYIETHCAAATLEGTAQHFGYAPGYLSAALRGETGESFIQYRNHFCLLRAAELLCRTDLSIAEVGTTVGMPSPSHFRRLFSEEFGVPPTKYRRIYQVR